MLPASEARMPKSERALAVFGDLIAKKQMSNVDRKGEKIMIQGTREIRLTI